MINGMTGFGASDLTFGKIRGTVEIKSVNHRYLDIVYYLPSGFISYEDKIQKRIGRYIKRGRLTVSVRIIDKPEMMITLNRFAVKRYMDFAKNLTKNLHLKNDLSTADLLKLPGVVEVKEVFVGAAQIWPLVEKALDKALASVVAMRKREGRSLATDINEQLNRMTMRIRQIKARVNDILKEKRTTFKGEEFLSFQKSNDINEEMARLLHHINEAKALLKTMEGGGKKLDFIAQEMQREINTIGSKVQDKEISANVIAMKSKVEKIREQANNVE